MLQRGDSEGCSWAAAQVALFNPLKSLASANEIGTGKLLASLGEAGCFVGTHDLLWQSVALGVNSCVVPPSDSTDWLSSSPLVVGGFELPTQSSYLNHRSQLLQADGLSAGKIADVLERKDMPLL